MQSSTAFAQICSTHAGRETERRPKRHLCQAKRPRHPHFLPRKRRKRAPYKAQRRMARARRRKRGKRKRFSFIDMTDSFQFLFFQIAVGTVNDKMRRTLFPKLRLIYRVPLLYASAIINIGKRGARIKCLISNEGDTVRKPYR